MFLNQFFPAYAGKCDVCERDWLTAQFHCIDCDQDICRFCIHSHRLETHEEPPKILRFEKNTDRFQVSSNKSCEKHKDEVLQLFCSTCQEAICISCSCDTHKRHYVIPISAKLQESKTYLQLELDRLTSEKRKIMSTINAIEKVKNEVLEVSKNSMLYLDAAAEKACASIMNRKEKLKNEIIVSEKDQISTITEAIKVFKNYIDNVDRGLSFLSELQDDDICLEVVDTYKSFLSKKESMRKAFSSNKISLQFNEYTASNNIRTKNIKSGIISYSYYFFGKLGSLKKKSFYLSVDEKSLVVTKNLKGISLVSESQITKFLLRFLFSFLLCQLLFFIWDFMGLYPWLESLLP